MTYYLYFSPGQLILYQLCAMVIGSVGGYILAYVWKKAQDRNKR